MRISLLFTPWLLPDRALRKIIKKYYPVDRWLRYTAVNNSIIFLSRSESMNVLDVGGGDGIIKYYLSSKHRIFVVDLEKKAIIKAIRRKINAMVANAYNLPFENNAFDIVISVDSLEHVDNKALYCEELKRVAKKAVVLHCPVDSRDGIYQGTAYDQRYFTWYQKKFHMEEINTKEHLLMGLPMVEELATLFPGAKILPQQSCDTWLKLMQIKEIPYIGLFSVMMYKCFLEKHDNQPPYHASLICWEKHL